MVIVVAAVSGCGSAAQADGQSKLSWQQVTTGDITRDVVLVGTLHPRSRTPVFPAVAGRIRRILVKRGDRVTKGEPLVELERDKAEGDVEARRLQLLRIRSSQAGDLSGRQDEAGEQRTVERLELQAAELEQAHRMMRDAELALKEHTVIAPRAGTIIQMNLREGQFLGPSAPGAQSFLSVADDDGSEIDAEVDEYDVAFLKSGIEAAALVESIGVKTVATIQDDPALVRLRGSGTNSSVYNIRFSLSDTFGPSQWGSTVRLRIHLTVRTGVLRLPQSSVVAKGAKQYAAVRRGESIQIVPVDVGLCDADRCEVNGLSAGTWVAVADLAALLQLVEAQQRSGARMGREQAGS